MASVSLLSCALQPPSTMSIKDELDSSAVVMLELKKCVPLACRTTQLRFDRI